MTEQAEAGGYLRRDQRTLTVACKILWKGKRAPEENQGGSVCVPWKEECQDKGTIPLCQEEWLRSL